MIAFICLFFPALLAVYMFERITQKKLDTRGFIFLYAFMNLLINTCAFLIKVCVLHVDNFLIQGNITDMNPREMLYYLLIAIPLTIIAAFAVSIYSKHVKVRIEENKENEDEKNTKK